MSYIFHFLIWTFCLYWPHRTVHAIPLLKQIHYNHHRCVTQNMNDGKWHYNNLILFNDTRTTVFF
jgi:sterol desaturase/sphingolipid hydroxylase (fatty acid hydroxylase superfamily)